MTYESPLKKIYGDITSQMVKQDEDNILYTVKQNVGYNVDKDELIKALQYDRKQYQKGYDDCTKEWEEKMTKILIEQTNYEEEWYEPFYSCPECYVDFMVHHVTPNYCPFCGAKIVGIKEIYRDHTVTTYLLDENGEKECE